MVTNYFLSILADVKIDHLHLSLQFDDRRPFVILAFENGLEYWNYDFSILIGHQYLNLG